MVPAIWRLQFNWWHTNGTCYEKSVAKKVTTSKLGCKLLEDKERYFEVFSQENNSVIK